MAISLEFLTRGDGKASPFLIERGPRDGSCQEITCYKNELMPSLATATDALVTDEAKDQDKTSLKCLVDSRCMRSSSSYFQALLDPRRGFAEANALSSTQGNETHHVTLAMPHDAALSLGRCEKSKKYLVLCQMLRVLHRTNSSYEPLFYTQVDLAFFLALAIDRYVISNPPVVNDSAREASDQSGKRLRNCFCLEQSKDFRSWSIEDEASCRKLVYSQQRLGLTKNIASITRRLIIMGSDIHNDWFREEERRLDSVIWSLPAGLEGESISSEVRWALFNSIKEEIFTRRRVILRKISDCIDTALQKYASSSPQCRFGYGNSLSCDTFQFGQTIRFLGRKGLMNITSRSTISGSDGLSPMYANSLFTLIKELRAMPSYQIDAYHQHCGIKKDIIPTLDHVESLLVNNDCVGICGACWLDNQGSVTWQSTVAVVPETVSDACLKQPFHRKSSDFFLVNALPSS